MFHGDVPRSTQTVSVKSDLSENEEKNVATEDNDPNRKKREWTPAREAAWEKCLEGRKRYMETKKELTTKEQEDKKLKEKIRIEMLKKQIRAEIETELKSENNILSGTETEEKETLHAEKHPVDEPVEKLRNSKKLNKSKIRVEESDTESSTEVDSEEERRKRRKHRSRRKKHHKRKKYYDSSSSSEEETSDNKKKRQSTQKTFQAPPSSYLNRFQFV